VVHTTCAANGHKATDHESFTYTELKSLTKAARVSGYESCKHLGALARENCWQAIEDWNAID